MKTFIHFLALTAVMTTAVACKTADLNSDTNDIEGKTTPGSYTKKVNSIASYKSHQYFRVDLGAGGIAGRTVMTYSSPEKGAKLVALEALGKCGESRTIKCEGRLVAFELTAQDAAKLTVDHGTQDERTVEMACKGSLNSSPFGISKMVCDGEIEIARVAHLKSLGESAAFKDRIGWINESYDEGRNGSFDWFENQADAGLTLWSKQAFKNCKASSIDEAVSYMAEEMSTITDESSETEVETTNKALADFKQILIGTSNGSQIEACSFSKEFEDQYENRRHVDIRTFRNKATKYYVIFLTDRGAD